MPEANDEDPRSIDELFAAATDWSRNEGEGDWSAVTALQWIGSREMLDKALQLLQSADLRAQAKAADILGQLGVPRRSYPDECLAAVTRLVARDTDATVLHSAVVAVGHLGDSRGIREVAGVADHPDPNVRQAVAFTLRGRSEPEAVAALIHLTGDQSAFVRDWATFGLGGCNSPNTPEVRDALYRCIHDADEQTRSEALNGLARCRDLRVVPALIETLRKDEYGVLWPLVETLLNIDLEKETEEVTTDDLISRLLALMS